MSALMSGVWFDWPVVKQWPTRRAYTKSRNELAVKSVLISEVASCISELQVWPGQPCSHPTTHSISQHVAGAVLYPRTLIRQPPSQNPLSPQVSLSRPQERFLAPNSLPLPTIQQLMGPFRARMLPFPSLSEPLGNLKQMPSLLLLAPIPPLMHPPHPNPLLLRQLSLLRTPWIFRLFPAANLLICRP